MQIPLLFLCKVQDVELSLQFCLQEVPILSVTGEQSKGPSYIPECISVQSALFPCSGYGFV